MFSRLAPSRSAALICNVFTARTAESCLAAVADPLLIHWIMISIRLHLLRFVMHQSCAAL